MLTIVCVLKRPPTAQLRYDAGWVQKLRNGVARNLTVPHRFVCLTDMEVPDVETIPLQHDWMLYWSKVEMFRPGLFDGQCLYMDIDSMICGPIDDLVTPYPGMIMLTDYYPWFKNSGLMLWDASNPAFGELYRLMVADPIGTMVKFRYRGISSYGDQEFTANTLASLGVPLAEWQQVKPAEWFLPFSFEGRINPLAVSPSTDVRFCYSLGAPKFDEHPGLPIVRDHWH